MKVMIFDVGGTEIKYSVMDDAMNRYESGSIPTPSDSQPHFLETLAQLYRPHRDEVDGIALSLPGFIDAEHGVVRGGGLIINGQLVRGRDFTAGEYSFMNTNADAWSDGKKSMACQCSTSALLDAYRVRKQLPADVPMNGRIFFDAANAGEPEALEVLEAFCMAVDVQIYNLSVLLDLEKVAIGGGISGQPLLIETLDRVYEEKILKGHPFSEEQARSLPRPEIVPCAFHNEANQIGALVSYLNAFYPQK